ncbi:MAG: hypothetical protein FD152_1268 [Xanthobacteraceae bacterium]|nr:MAG: hypothetical protein FD152_1268 [Xanthobacteraceae bacterium]
MSVERILVVFNEDGSVKGIASYAVNGAAEPMTEEAAAALLPHADLLAQVQALQAREKANNDRVKAAEEDRDAKVAEKDARIAELEARIAALTAEPERTIHKAYLRAALAGKPFEKLVEVDAAVRAAGAAQWELWANATTISQDDADVNAISDALGIDLDAVFTAARAIRAARGG